MFVPEKVDVSGVSFRHGVDDGLVLQVFTWSVFFLFLSLGE